MEKELLQKALDSILHGSTQIISEPDGYGGISHKEIRINDLRVPLINQIALQLVKTDGFKEALLKAFTPEVIKQIQETTLSKLTWSDMSYDLKKKIEAQMTIDNVQFRKVKIVIETVDKD